ncbi:DUF1450 domain-containing protein [Bacillus aquiflavi]|uniref:DUF1450 domain-containing protein n=1 Tax=Bacillus aquiflavi TaxID=2672567 RepID=A0A6B3VXY5_9BACI|nr:DUF1450 domain-containing protein [Bacillus aquiflavi]MBA4537545.1 DUF1450 domain-containing protein [Bacillus aquiflavi]NEY81802.1 DUF1450 domain-containing protein [Bacillus aquiflavi]UAC47837.1 DUF1450 domain-containing protein [Bacillus aquiflavi]
MKPIIEFCLSNLGTYSYKAFEILEKDSNLDLVEYSCTSNCELCAESIFCLVNGEPVTGNDPEDLVKNVYLYLEENPMF